MKMEEISKDELYQFKDHLLKELKPVVNQLVEAINNNTKAVNELIALKTPKQLSIEDFEIKVEDSLDGLVKKIVDGIHKYQESNPINEPIDVEPNPLPDDPIPESKHEEAKPEEKEVLTPEEFAKKLASTFNTKEVNQRSISSIFLPHDTKISFRKGAYKFKMQIGDYRDGTTFMTYSEAVRCRDEVYENMKVFFEKHMSLITSINDYCKIKTFKGAKTILLKKLHELDAKKGNDVTEDSSNED